MDKVDLLVKLENVMEANRQYLEDAVKGLIEGINIAIEDFLHDSEIDFEKVLKEAMEGK